MESVVEEIAKQLGIAAETTGQFIATYLPDFAHLQALKMAVPLVVVWILFALCMVVALVAFVVCVKVRRVAIAEDSIWHPRNWYNYTSFWVSMTALVVGSFLLFIGVLATAVNVPQIVGWFDFPEAMLVDMALSKIGG